MIDPESLLQPVPGEHPQGIDLRTPSFHPAFADLNRAVLALQRASQKAADTREEWIDIEEMSSAVLAEHSKDMAVAAWLVEALVRTGAFAGVAAGGQLIAGLINRFWPVLFPTPDPEEPGLTHEQARLEPVVDLLAENGRFLAALRGLTLFRIEDGTRFSLTTCRAAKEWTALGPALRQKRLSDLSRDHRSAFEKSPEARLWETIRPAISSEGMAAIRAALIDIAGATKAWQGVGAALDAKVRTDAIDLTALLDCLDDIRSILAEFVEPDGDASAAAAATAAGAPDGPAAREAERGGPEPREAGISSREEGLRRLAELSAFFRRTEPHSPVSFMLEEALRRARMSLPDLLAEVIPEKARRDEVYMRLGLRPDGTPT